MSKHSKMVALALVVAMLATAAVMAGCSGGTATSTTAAPAKATVKTVTAGTLVAGSDTAFPPFESMNGNTAEGFDVDVVAAIAKQMGLKSEFKSYKFDTLIPTIVAGGKFDIIASG